MSQVIAPQVLLRKTITVALLYFLPLMIGSSLVFLMVLLMSEIPCVVKTEGFALYTAAVGTGSLLWSLVGGFLMAILDGPC